MDPSAELDRLLMTRVEWADYLAARGRPVWITPLAGGSAAAHGELRDLGALSPPADGFEAFWLSFAVRDASPAQALYRVDIDGLPAHALLLVPSGRRDGVTEYHAAVNRTPP